MGVLFMFEWIFVGLILLTILVGGSYLYYLAHLIVTITKCPDCGRIMQKVMYLETEDNEQKHIVYECRFCQAKRIRPVYRGKRFTMYP
jgi:hypothetical protein